MNISFLYKFTNIRDLPQHQQWTKVEAEDMAENEYRDTYLSSKYYSDV